MISGQNRHFGLLYLNQVNLDMVTKMKEEKKDVAVQDIQIVLKNPSNQGRAPERVLTQNLPGDQPNLESRLNQKSRGQAHAKQIQKHLLGKVAKTVETVPKVPKAHAQKPSSQKHQLPLKAPARNVDAAGARALGLIASGKTRTRGEKTSKAEALLVVGSRLRAHRFCKVLHCTHPQDSIVQVAPKGLSKRCARCLRR